VPACDAGSSSRRGHNEDLAGGRCDVRIASRKEVAEGILASYEKA